METVGRFAPSPSGRMHLGNLLCALLAWLSAKSDGGRILLRIEDLDTARCKPVLTTTASCGWHSRRCIYSASSGTTPMCSPVITRR